jgi:Pyruvate/2-oxoacid:ferredoxin oxidoreductase delta subunit
MGCIKMSIGSKGIFEPVVDMTRCSDCGLCMEVAPVMEYIMMR